MGLATSLEAAFANDRIGHVWSTFDRDEQDGMAAVVRSAREDVQREKTALTSAAESARIREEADAEAARAAEEERQAREAREREAEADARQRATVPAPPAAAAPTPARQAPTRGSSLDQVGLARRGELTGGRSFR